MSNASSKSAEHPQPHPLQPETPGGDQPAEPAKPAGSRVTWGPLAAIVYPFVLVEGVQQVVAPLLLAIPFLVQGWPLRKMQSALNNSVTAQFFFFLIAEGLTFAGIWWFLRRRNSSLKAIGWRKPELMDLAIAFGAYILYFVVYLCIISGVTHLLPQINLNQSQDIGFSTAAGAGSLVLVYISLAVLPPVAEETVFRGFMFSGLKRRLPVVLAAVITSAIFAAAHLEFGSGQALLWVAALDTFTLSMVLCLVRQKTGALWAGIFVHAIKNSVAFYELFIRHIH